MKYEAVEDFLKIESPDFLMLQNTKIKGETLLDLSRIKWKRNVGKVVSARGSSGGLAMVWSEEMFQLVSSFETWHQIYTELCHKINKISISLFNLYVLVHFLEKKDFWKYFVEINSPTNIIVDGDLNLVFDPKEKRGRINNRDQMLPLVEDLIQQWDILDFKPKKGLYTWTNNKIGASHISA